MEMNEFKALLLGPFEAYDAGTINRQEALANLKQLVDFEIAEEVRDLRKRLDQLQGGAVETVDSKIVDGFQGRLQGRRI